MRLLDRGNYVRNGSSAYMDSPQSIGHDVTISAPHMHAAALEYLEAYLRPGMRALDLGSGTGYLTVAMMLMVTEGGNQDGAAFGIEYVEPLVPWSIDNIRKDGKGHWFDNPGSFMVKSGDGSKGWAEKGPFHAIHVGAAAPKVPKPLVDQLACPGRMVIPVGPRGGSQELLLVDKDVAGNVKTRSVMGVRYVPFHMDGTEPYTA